MKRISYILFLAILGFMTSCEVEDGDLTDNKTYQGYRAFQNVQAYTADCTLLIDMMARVDLYANSTAEERQWITKLYLEGYSIEEKDDRWLLQGNDNHWEFVHNGKSIHEAGAQWTVALVKKNTDEGKTYKVIEDGNFILTSKGDKSWDIKVNALKDNVTKYILTPLSNAYSYVFESNPVNQVSANYSVSAEAVPEGAASMYIYTITAGGGKVSPELNMEYIFSKPTLCGDYIDYYFNNGVIQEIKDGEIDLLIKVKEGVEDKINVKIQDARVSVTMNDVTEEY